MVGKYASMDRLEKAFVWLSVFMAVAILAVYLIVVTRALRMDPDSFRCTSDSMMMQLCHHPYSASISWTFIYSVFFGWPVLVAWLALGARLIIRRKA